MSYQIVDRTLGNTDGSAEVNARELATAEPNAQGSLPESESFGGLSYRQKPFLSMHTERLQLLMRRFLPRYRYFFRDVFEGWKDQSNSAKMEETTPTGVLPLARYLARRSASAFSETSLSLSIDPSSL